MAAPTTSKQRLALAICDFLSTSATDGTLPADDKDSVEVAINCIAESFNVDPNDKAAVTAAIGDQNLLNIYGVYERLKNPNATKPETTAPTAAQASTAAPATSAHSDAVKKEAEALKSKGNAAMAQKDYTTAIDFYTQALALHPGNAVYLSNRAAAYSTAKDHESAVADAEAAVAVDPNYTKGWSRLGLARFALGDAKGSMAAYQQGIEHEGNGGSDLMRKGFETAKRKVDEQELDGGSGQGARDFGAGGGGAPNLGDLASMFGGGGRGGGGGGGMPDFASIMSNPMFANMAQQLMSNPDMMSNLMSNPRLRDMASSLGNGGGMPDMSSIMSDPNIAEMARSLMGGGAPGAGRGSGPPGGPGAPGGPGQ